MLHATTTNGALAERGPSGSPSGDNTCELPLVVPSTAKAHFMGAKGLTMILAKSFGNILNLVADRT